MTRQGKGAVCGCCVILLLRISSTYAPAMFLAQADCTHLQHGPGLGYESTCSWASCLLVDVDSLNVACLAWLTTTGAPGNTCWPCLGPIPYCAASGRGAAAIMGKCDKLQCEVSWGGIRWQPLHSRCQSDSKAAQRFSQGVPWLHEQV
jgi:hypothetical protein